MTEIVFNNPSYLFLLFFIPLIILFHFVGLSRKRKNALKFANFEAISKIKGIDLYSKNISTLVFYTVMIFLKMRI